MDTMTDDHTTDDTEPTRDYTGDLVAAMTTRFAWADDTEFSRSVDRARERRNRKAEGMAQVAERVVGLDLPWPQVSTYVHQPRHQDAEVVASWVVDDLDTFRALARRLRHATGTMATKTNDDGSLTATVMDGRAAWDVQLAATSSPCEQVQVGTETKVEREEITPPRYREVEREVPVYEWRCPDSILDTDTDDL